nr:hypothetical protein [Tanacetum cinerariifolium]
MARLQFCDYHNMVAILEKNEHNSDFHPIVDFIEASPLRYALTFKPTIYVSHIRQFWFTARIETTAEGTQILATVDECLSPKSIGFNEFSSNIATALVCLATNRTYNFSKMIFDGLVKNINNKVSKFLMYPWFLTMCLRMDQFVQITHTQKYVVPFHIKNLFTTLRVNSPSFSGRIVPLFDSMLIQQGEGLGTSTEHHHTPSKEAQPSSPTHISTSSIPTVIPIPTVTQSEPTPLKQYTRRARIAQSSALPPIADEPASPVRDVGEGEACPTDSGFIADQDRATIAKPSTLPHDTTPRVTSPAAVEGSMQQTINELMALCTILQRQHSELLVQFKAQEVEINMLKERIKILEDNQRVIGARFADDAPIKGRRIDVEEGVTGRVSSNTEKIRMDEGEVAVERTSEDTKEMATVLTSMDATTVLAGGIDVPTGSYFIPIAGPLVVDIHTGSDAVPTASPIVSTATIVTLYSRRKGKEVMVESDTLKKQRLQEQIDAQVAREMEEQQEREDKRMTEQIARNADVAKIHAEEELQGMIDSLDRTNETIAKYLQEYQDFASELPLERRIELISNLVKYQDNYSKIYKFQSQQRRPWTKNQKKDYYMTVIRNNLGWKVKDFKGTTFEEIKAKFATVWKLVEDFIPMGSKEEAERLKRKGFNLEQEKAKKQKTSEEVPDKEKSPEEIPEEKVKEMMQLIPIEEVYVQALQVKHPIIDWKVHIEGQRSYWKIIRLGGSSVCYQFFVDLLKNLDREDLNQLWVIVKEYLSIRPASSDKEMKLWGRIVGNKMHKAFPLLVRKFPLPEGTSHSLKKNATARRKVLPLLEVCTAINVKEKPYTKIQFRSIFVVSHLITLQRLLSVLTTLEDPDLSFQQRLSEKMDQDTAHMVDASKVPMLKPREFEIWRIRHAPAIESSSDDAQNRNPSVTKIKALPSTISPKPFIKFVKATDSPKEIKTDKGKTVKKPTVKYAELHKKPSKKSTVRGNQRNWNNLKSQQLGANFVMKKKARFNCGDFDHLAYDCCKWENKGTSRPQNNTHKSFTPRSAIHRSYRSSMKPTRPNMNARVKRLERELKARTPTTKIHKVKRGRSSGPAVETLNAKTSKDVPKVVKKDNGAPIIKYWKSNDEDECVPQPKIEKKTVKPSVAKSMKKLIENMLPLEVTPKEGKSLAKSLMKKMYFLIVTDGYSRFTWVFFLSTKDETSGILKSFITIIENLVDHKVKVIRCDNGTNFKNRYMNQFCEIKGIMRQYNVARTPHQNGVTKRRNRTLVEATRTMLADSKLLTTFWTEAVSTACYVQNRVLVVKPHNKTPYALFYGRTPMLSFMRPFGCPVTILNTIDHLGKFDGKVNEGLFVGYSLNSNAFRVLNSRTRIVKETFHIRLSENTLNNVGSGPYWLFDIDAITNTMSYQPVVTGTQSNGNAGTKDNNNAGQIRKKKESGKDYILLPLWTADLPFPQEPKSSQDVGFKPSNDVGKKVNEVPGQKNKCKDQEEKDNVNITNRGNVVHSTVNAASNEVNDVSRKSNIKLPDDLDMPKLEDIIIFEHSNEDVFGAKADLNNLQSTFQVSLIPTTRIHKDHPLELVMRDLHSAPKTRRMRQDTIGDTSAHTKYKSVSKMSSDSQLTGVNTPQSNEDRLKHIELMKIYTTLQKKVFDLEDELKRTKTAQQTKIDGLEMIVKKLKKKQRSRTHKLKRLYKVGIKDIGKEEVIEVVTTAMMIIDTVVDASEVTTVIADILVSAGKTIVTTAPTITAESTKINVEVTQDHKRKGVMIQEPEETTITKTASLQQPQVHDKAMKRVNTFVDYKTELVVEGLKKDEVTEGSLNRTIEELEEENAKKQKIKDDKESTELKQCLEIIPDDGDNVTIDATPLSFKYPIIVDYKIYKEGKKNYFQIFKADDNSQMYLTFSKLLKNFDREDLEVL